MKGYRFVYRDLEEGRIRESHLIGDIGDCFRKVMEFLYREDNAEFVKLEEVSGGGAGGTGGCVGGILIKGEIENVIR